MLEIAQNQTLWGVQSQLSVLLRGFPWLYID